MSEPGTQSRTMTYMGLFEGSGQGSCFSRVRIPLIQRGYAQGRSDPGTGRIRDRFIEALVDAVTGGGPLSLDFVYGLSVPARESEGGKEFLPLDGQQRLTALFLLHWYVAWRLGKLDLPESWTQFAYATRPSSQRFCEFLPKVRQPPANDSSSANTDIKVSDWIKDQPEFQCGWESDPTVSSMLTVVDVIADRLRTCDLESVWQQLGRSDEGAVTFQLLDIGDGGSGETLAADRYITMNSRGLLLTEFEKLKAAVESELSGVDGPELEDGRSARKVVEEGLDGPWSDLFWDKDAPESLDESLLDYLTFVIEVCEWTFLDEREKNDSGSTVPDDISDRARRVFGPRNARRDAAWQFLVDSFECWVGTDRNGSHDAGPLSRSASEFLDRFCAPSQWNPDDPDDCRIVLFVTDSRNMPLYRRGARAELWEKLVLCAQITALTAMSRDCLTVNEAVRRTRVVRNVVEAAVSTDVLRPGVRVMPDLLDKVTRIVLQDPGDPVAFDRKELDRAWRGEEDKRRFCEAWPELDRDVLAVENHPLFRGVTGAWTWDARLLPAQVGRLHGLFPAQGLDVDEGTAADDLAAALLAGGEYQFRSGHWRFLPPRHGDLYGRWHAVVAQSSLSDPSVDDHQRHDGMENTAHGLRGALQFLLGGREGQPESRTPRELIDQWLLEAEWNVPGGRTWRYYFVKYWSTFSSCGRWSKGCVHSDSSRMGYRAILLDTIKANGYQSNPYFQAAAFLLRSADTDGRQLSVESLPVRGMRNLPRLVVTVGAGSTSGREFCLEQTSGAEFRLIAPDDCPILSPMATVDGDSASILSRLEPSSDEAERGNVDATGNGSQEGRRYSLTIRQSEGVDTEDRVELIVAIVRALVHLSE